MVEPRKPEISDPTEDEMMAYNNCICEDCGRPLVRVTVLDSGSVDMTYDPDRQKWVETDLNWNAQDEEYLCSGCREYPGSCKCPQVQKQ